MQEINNIKFHRFSIGEAFTRLGSTKAGLSEDKSTERLDKFGFNEITETKKEPAWKNLLGQFANLLIMILIIAAIISALMGDIIEAGIDCCHCASGRDIGFHTGTSGTKGHRITQKDGSAQGAGVA